MVSSREIVAALGSPVIGMISEGTRLEAMEAAVKRGYALKGLAVSGEVDEEVKSSAAVLSEKVLFRWPGLTMGEVMLAIEAGVCGDFGGDRRLAVGNYLAWIGAYVKCDARRDALRARDAAAAQKAGLLLEAGDVRRRNEESVRSQAAQAWDAYCRTGKTGIMLDGRAAAIYDYLQGRGKIKARPETVQKAAQRAREKESGRMYRSVGERAGEGEEWAVKRELLEMYFESLKARGAELRL